MWRTERGQREGGRGWVLGFILKKNGMVDLNTGDWVHIDVERSGALMGLAIW